jgi:hypothetical protein
VTSKHFVLDGLPPGRYSLIVQSLVEQKNSKRKLAVSGFHLGSQDLMTSPVVISESGNPPPEIRLSTETGRLTVKTTRADGSPQLGLVNVAQIGIVVLARQLFPLTG